MRDLVRAGLGAMALGAAIACFAGATAWADDSVPALTPPQVNRAITPPGGIKAAMPGGNTVGDVIREAKPRADGYRHVDTPATIARLRREGLNTYLYQVWGSPTDWDDLVNEFAPAAQRAGIKVWVYIVPPSECQDNPVPHLRGRCSRPYKTDYVAWAQAIARLSNRYSSVVAWALDDFFFQLTPDYMRQVREAQDAINPRLGFYTTVYYGDAVGSRFYDTYGQYIDGIIYPYTGANSNVQDASEVGRNLDAILAQTQPRGLGVLLLNYAGRYLSAIRTPTDRYVADVIDATRPYMQDGRVMGIALYGLPLADGPAVAADNRAQTGIGRLDFSVSVFGLTKDGDYAEAEQPVTVDPSADRYELSFSDYDVYYDQYMGASDYHTIQVLVDGSVAWESNQPGSGGTWHHHTIDLTAALRGRTSATLAFRLVDKHGTSSYPTDIGIDDVSSRGFRVRNGGFETERDWKLTSTNDVILPSIDLFPAHFPRNILRAAAAALAGRSYSEQPAEGYKDGGDALYGHGRLSLAVAGGSVTPAGACAQASQVLRVDPRSPRYELSFWEYSRHAPYATMWGRHKVTVSLDGQPLVDTDANGWYPIWLNGSTLQGPIDVTDLVRGKTEVTLKFQLCGAEQPPAGANLPVDLGFDDVETVGLDVHDPGFENGSAWTLSSSAPGLSARIR